MVKVMMYLSIFIVCFVSVTVVNSKSLRFNGVNNFEIKSEEKELFDLLMHTKEKKTTTIRVGKYVFKNCGNASQEMLDLQSLVLGPDPITFPGDLDVSFSGEIKSDVDAPLKAVVLLQRKVGSTYIKIPCIGNIGSCTYDDLCELLQGAVCPPPFVTNKIPCKCPFKMGTYKLPKTTFEVDAAVFPPGDYHASANLTINGKLVTCVDLQATFD